MHPDLSNMSDDPLLDIVETMKRAAFKATGEVSSLVGRIGGDFGGAQREQDGNEFVSLVFGDRCKSKDKLHYLRSQLPKDVYDTERSEMEDAHHRLGNPDNAHFKSVMCALLTELGYTQKVTHVVQPNYQEPSGPPPFQIPLKQAPLVKQLTQTAAIPYKQPTQPTQQQQNTRATSQHQPVPRNFVPQQPLPQRLTQPQRLPQYEVNTLASYSSFDDDPDSDNEQEDCRPFPVRTPIPSFPRPTQPYFQKPQGGGGFYESNRSFGAM